MVETPILDPDDPRLDPFRTVTDPALVRRQGLFVAEGRRTVARLLRERPEALVALLLTPPARAWLGETLARVPAGADVLVVDAPSTIAGIAGVRFHQGCVGLARLPTTTDAWPRALAPGPRLVVVLEGVTDPDNVGAIFRSALAFGATCVLLAPGCAHPLYRKALRTSLGTALRLPYADAVPWPDALDRLRDAGYDVVALTPAPDARPIADVQAGLGARRALLLGSEGLGLSREALARAPRCARIPIDPSVDSLNVAAAAAIALCLLGGVSPSAEGS